MAPPRRPARTAVSTAGPHRPVRSLVLIWLGWAILMMALPAFVQARFDLKRPDSLFTWTPDETAADPHAGATGLDRLLSRHVYWDSRYYLSIAARGYDDPQMDAVSSTANPDDPGAAPKREQPGWITLNYAFFPAYPMAIRALSEPLAILGLTPVGTNILAGLLISFGGTLGAMLALRELVRDDTAGGDGLRAAFYLLVWPASAFLAQVYTEGLFLGLSFGALALLRRKRWLWAAVLGAFATWTRATGVLLLIPFVWAWFAEGRLRTLLRRPTLGEAGRLFCAGAPALAYLVWRATLGGRFTLVEQHYFAREAFAVARSWNSWVSAAQALVDGGAQVRAYNLVEFFALAAGIAASALLWRRDRPLALYGLAVIAVALTSGDYLGMTRYVLSVPALFLVPARWGRNPAFDRLWTLGGGLLMTVFAIAFSFGFWAG
jgi:hypothetical protein